MLFNTSTPDNFSDRYFSQDLLGYYGPRHTIHFSKHKPIVKQSKIRGRITYRLLGEGNVIFSFDVSIFSDPILLLSILFENGSDNNIIDVGWIQNKQATPIRRLRDKDCNSSEGHNIYLGEYANQTGYLSISISSNCAYTINALKIWCKRELFSTLKRNIYQCPSTGEFLEFTDNYSNLVSSDRSIEYPVINGMISFVGHNVPTIADKYVRHNYTGRVYALLGESPRDNLILDLGAGYSFTKYLNVIHYDVQHHPTTDVLGFGMKLPFRDNIFDHIISIQVMEHVPQPFTFANEAYRILKPGGKIYLTTAFMQSLHGFPHHYCNLTKQGVLEVMKQFNTISCDSQDHQKAYRSLWNVLGRYVQLLSKELREDFLETKVRDLLTELSSQKTDSRFADLDNKKLNDALASSFTFEGEKPINDEQPI